MATQPLRILYNQQRGQRPTGQSDEEHRLCAAKKWCAQRNVDVTRETLKEAIRLRWLNFDHPNSFEESYDNEMFGKFYAALCVETKKPPHMQPTEAATAAVVQYNSDRFALALGPHYVETTYRPN
jgi:hypothetical protein